jgi:hypothetical protein
MDCVAVIVLECGMQFFGTHERLLLENWKGVRCNPSACGCSCLPPGAIGTFVLIGQGCNLQQMRCQDISYSRHEIKINQYKNLQLLLLNPLFLLSHEFSMDNDLLGKNLYIGMNMSTKCLNQIHSLSQIVS